MADIIDIQGDRGKFISPLRANYEPKFVRLNSRKEETKRVIEKRRYETKRAS